jgi:predicted transposase YdaD
MAYVGPFSEWGKKHFNEGKAEGKAEGLAEGLAEGEAKGLAEAVLLVLEERGIPVSPDDRQRILACTDIHRLNGWVGRAARVGNATELFEAS